MLSQTVGSNETYNHDFAYYYDRITGHKDYQAEIDGLAQFIRETVSHSSPRLLDVGCGTGHHAGLLAEKGYDVTAIDLSPDMIEIAEGEHLSVRFKCGDIADLEEAGFHFGYSLFNVINCLDTMESLTRFFREIFIRIVDGGAFLVESWNPIAVIAVPPVIVERRYESDDERIVRKVTPASDFLHQRLDLRYDIAVQSGRGQQAEVKTFTVVHRLVLFTPLEIEYCLRQAGFRGIKIQTALPEMASAAAGDRMLAFTCQRPGAGALPACYQRKAAIA